MADFYLLLNNWNATNRKKWLWNVLLGFLTRIGPGPTIRVQGSLDKIRTKSKTQTKLNGRNRVPLFGPPSKITALI